MTHLFARCVLISIAYFSPPIAIDTPGSRSRESGDPKEVTPGNSECGTTPRHQTDSGIAGRVHTTSRRTCSLTNKETAIWAKHCVAVDRKTFGMMRVPPFTLLCVVWHLRYLSILFFNINNAESVDKLCN